ncbi:hypothetical protein DFH11DRAFT_1629833, partial [Phellopilus nigrolimitatus]
MSAVHIVQSVAFLNNGAHIIYGSYTNDHGVLKKFSVCPGGSTNLFVIEEAEDCRNSDFSWGRTYPVTLQRGRHKRYVTSVPSRYSSISSAAFLCKSHSDGKIPARRRRALARDERAVRGARPAHIRQHRRRHRRRLVRQQQGRHVCVPHRPGKPGAGRQLLRQGGRSRCSAGRTKNTWSASATLYATFSRSVLNWRQGTKRRTARSTSTPPSPFPRAAGPPPTARAAAAAAAARRRSRPSRLLHARQQRRRHHRLRVHRRRRRAGPGLRPREARPGGRPQQKTDRGARGHGLQRAAL